MPLRTAQPELLSIVDELPNQYQVNATAQQYQPAPYQPEQWWQTFEDPKLNSLLKNNLIDNLDLAESSARLKAALAQSRATKGSLFPQLNFNTQGSRPETNSTTSNTGGNNENAFIGGPNFENYSAALELSYEVDVWNKLRNLNKAQVAKAFAAESDLKALRLTVISETIKAYFELVDTRTQLDLLEKATGLLKERTQQTETRYSQGLVSSFELYQIRQEFRNIQATVPQNKARLAEIEGRLAILSGDYLHKIQALLRSDLKPKLAFNDLPLNMPASLLIQRPDVFAAAQRMKSARLTAGASRAELFPAISLTGQFSNQSTIRDNVFKSVDDWLLSLGAQLTAPIFQGGRIRANIAVADAEYAQASAAYARAVITAFQEVNTAIAAYDAQRSRYRFIFDQWQQAKHSTNLQTQRFKRGLTGYFDYLDALSQQYQVESELSASAKDVALAYLATHRALGGNWVDNHIHKELNSNSENVPSGDN